LTYTFHFQFVEFEESQPRLYICSGL